MSLTVSEFVIKLEYLTLFFIEKYVLGFNKDDKDITMGGNGSWGQNAVVKIL